MMEVRPSIICLTETLLFVSIGSVILPGYCFIVRKVRDDGRLGGGVVVFALASITNHVAPIFISFVAERVWCVINSEVGSFLICVWYRPLARGEMLSISTLQDEYLKLRIGAIRC